MTQYNKTTLDGFFQTGDIPTGTDFTNLIDSQINASEIVEQGMVGALKTPEVITSKVSGPATFTGTMTFTTGLNCNGVINTQIINASGVGISSGIVLTCDLSANNNTIFASAVRSTSGIYFGVGIVSAAGTAQGTAASLTFVTNRLQGVNDGAQTGFVIPANRTGLVQYILNETAVSANLWPPTGGKINNLSTNGVFALAGGQAYTIFHVAASAYGVK